MGVCNSPNIFQENISKLLEGFDRICTYIDDVQVITKNDLKYHMNALEKILQRLAEVGLKVNPEKSFFVQTETEYLGLWLIDNWMILLLSKVE